MWATLAQRTAASDLYGDRKALRVLRPGGGLERRMTAIGAIVGRRLAIGILERPREGVGRAVAGALGDCPDRHVRVRQPIRRSKQPQPPNRGADRLAAHGRVDAMPVIGREAGDLGETVGIDVLFQVRVDVVRNPVQPGFVACLRLRLGHCGRSSNLHIQGHLLTQLSRQILREWRLQTSGGVAVLGRSVDVDSTGSANHRAAHSQVHLPIK